MNRKQLIKEMEAFPELPEIDEFLSGAIREAKKKFGNGIGKSGLERNPTFQNGIDENKSYFFELNRDKDERWELGKFKLKKQPDIVKLIFKEFLEKVKDYKTSPGLIQKEILSTPNVGKAFEITFIKEKARVKAFAKVAEEKAESPREEAMKSSMIRVRTNYQNINREETYDKIFQLMEEKTEIREDIFFYFNMLRESTL